MNAYIIEGRLYGFEMPESFELARLSDAQGKALAQNVVFTRFEKDSSNQYEPFSRYHIYVGEQEILLPAGDYEVRCGNSTQSVTSVVSYRVASHAADNGQPLPFCDDVFAVILHGSDFPKLSLSVHTTETSRTFEKWPKILRDGNTEIFPDAGELSYTYPKTFQKDEPSVLSAFPDSAGLEGKIYLKHGDELTVSFDGKIIQTLRWDQISKIWYEKKNSAEYPLVEIKGGTYKMGDWRGKQANYSFGIHNNNMKKSWLQIYDPQFMGESERGEAALGVTGLRDENSSAKEKDSDFWCYNDDALYLHDVEVSDFAMGKYLVTMEQFYTFVGELKGSSDSELYYEINETRFPVHHVAGIGLWEKKQAVRDNGWGAGDRPAINLGINEMVEYCNWLSRKHGFEPCFEILPIYQGNYGKGLSTVSVYRCVGKSPMQRTVNMKEQVQLVEIRCDFSKNGYRLPTEAEFEYAMRGGNTLKEYNSGNGVLYAGVNDAGEEGARYVNDYAWQRRNTDIPLKSGAKEGSPRRDNMGGNGYTSPVGTKLPSQLGLYDLCGNTWDTMWDLYGRLYFKDCQAKGTVKDPRGVSYSVEQLSNLDGTDSDPFLKDAYFYTYEKQEDGSMKRVAARKISHIAKTLHVLKGGNFASPLGFIASAHRYVEGGVFNHLNYLNARVGFRMCRNTKE